VARLQRTMEDRLTADGIDAHIRARVHTLGHTTGRRFSAADESDDRIARIRM
jgi:hypothetical protein